MTDISLVPDKADAPLLSSARATTLVQTRQGLARWWRSTHARLKQQFGMARSRNRGDAGMRRTIFWAAIANKLAAVARHG